MNKHIMLGSLFILGLYSVHTIVSMDSKKNMQAALLSAQCPSDEQTQQEVAHNRTTPSRHEKVETEECKKRACCGVLTASSALIGLIVTIVCLSNQTPPHPMCDNYYLTRQNFADAPNMTWAITLDKCCFSSGSQTVFGDASLFSAGPSFTLGSYGSEVAWKNECATTTICVHSCVTGLLPSCPTIGYESVDKQSPNYFRNFQTPCHPRRKKSPLERRIAMARDKQKRSKALKQSSLHSDR